MWKTVRPLKWCAVAVVGIVGCVASLGGCSSPRHVDAQESLPTSIRVEKAVYFPTTTGDIIHVQPGTYEVREDHGVLQLSNEQVDDALKLETQTTRHDERVTTATPLSFSEDADEQVIILLLPDGTALEATGSRSGIQSRAARKTRRRVSQAAIRRQFNRAVLSSRVRREVSTHFTLRVPVQLHDLNADINQLKVRCWAHRGNDATKYDQRIGEGEATAPITNRQFHKTVVVKFNAAQGKEPEEADRYYCGILFHKPGIGFRQPAKYGHPLANGKPAWLISAEGTPFAIHAQGSVN